MKHLLFIALFLLTVAASAFADAGKVNYAVLKNFETNYQLAKNVTWKTTRDYSKAVFWLEGQKMEAFYTHSGDLIASTTAISTNEVPLAVKRSIAKKADGYNIVEAIRFHCPDEECYYVSVENDKETIIFKATETGYVTFFKKTKK